jgi:uncharacterized protein YfaS (alpha-2-macroglobulin family)
VHEGKYEDADAFGLAQQYRLSIGAGLTAQNGVALAPLTRDLVANPPKPSVDALDWPDGQPTLVLTSNQPLDEASLRQHLRATFADTPVALRLEPVDADTLASMYGVLHAWFLRFDALPTTPGVLQVDLAPGLRSLAGPAPGPGGRLWTQTINAPFLLTDARCDREFGGDGDIRPGEPLSCAAESDVLLFFSRRLDPASVAAWARQLPAGLALAEDPDECGYRCSAGNPARQAAIRLTPAEAGRRYRIDAGRPLRAVGGDGPARAVAIDLQVRDFDPGVFFEPPIQVLLPDAADAAQVSARNLPALQWAQATLGSRRTTLAIHNLPASTPRNRFVPLDVPGLDPQVRRHGGLVLGGIAVTPQFAGAMPAYDAHSTAIAAFNLIAVPEPGRILVWASDWAGADALVGVDVDLIALASDGSETVLGRARTGADGSAWLAHAPLPEHGRYGEPPATYLLLRARHRGRSTVLPLEGSESQQGSGMDGVEQTTRWSGAPGIRWGATSRLLYRPGDHVDWRLWLRERHGLALRRPEQDAVVLELRASGANYGMGRVHEEWSATLDEWGSVSGRMRLPETLEDGVYCVAEKIADRGWNERVTGACFQVARFDAPSLWATLTTPDVVRLRGESVPLAGNAGFFSGGPAANAGAELRGTARAARFSEAWPALARWDFLDEDLVHGVSGQPLAGLTPPTKLDGEGRYAFDLPLPQVMEGADDNDGDARTLAFARLQFNLAVNDGGKAQAFSAPAAMYFAGHETYVGLRTASAWLTMDADPLVEAVVATHVGVLLPDVDVQLRIETNDATPTVLAQCKLRSGREQACPFRAPAAGVYVLVAEAGAAAPVRIRRWFGNQPQPTAALAAAAEVSLAIATPAGAGTPARLRLHQPHASARALVLVEHEGVLAHWLQDVGPDGEIVVPVQPHWQPGVSVRVLVRPRAASAAEGFALPTRMVAARLDLPRTETAVVGVELAADELAPGAEAVLILHNPHAEARLVTLAIVDDAVHQQASAVRPMLDPAGPTVLGRLGQWRIGAWRGLENWKRMRNPLFRHFTATPIDVVGVAPGASAPLAPPAPPPPPAEPGAPRYDSATLDSIEVTGSRIADANVGEGRPVEVATRDPLAVLPTGMAGPAAERVRSRFPEAAYWEPGLVLAAGERRELRVRLPDNLTRWRVLAWVSDRGGDFELHEVTLQTSLAVELRTGLPAMLYPGDAGEGIVSARWNDAGGAHLSLQATATGAGVQATTGGDGDVAAHDLLARALALAPTAAGRIDVLAHASDGTRSDALSAAVPVRSRHSRLAIAQTGWLDRGEIVLGRAPLPAGASEPTLSVSVSPGLQAWRREWIDGLRRYPHRCWEQILSRGIGAAFALRDVQSAADWPEAQQLIDDAWRVAAQYRDGNGRYVYFTGSSAGRYSEPDTNLALSAYTLRGFAALTALGQPAPAHLRDPLQALLRNQLAQGSLASIADDPWALDTHAAIAGALADADALTDDAVVGEHLRGLWQHWDDLSWYGRSELVRALAALPALQAEAQQGLRRLRGAGVQRGASRRLDDPRDFTQLMGSSLRDQCALVTTLATLDTSAPGVVVRGEFLRGLQDLYAGGNASLDSQANAQCLLALRAAGVDLDGTQRPVVAQLRIDDRTTALAPANAADATGDPPLATGTVRWAGPLPDGELVLAATPSPDLSYLAEVGYAIDLRDVRASGTGMQLERRYAVLRGGRWVALGEDGARVGDWLRVTLQLTVPRDRHFVAITDVVPGGWASRDVSLAGVAGEDVRRIAEPGSSWFATRQTGAGEVKLYAERLPAGVHEVHWYAQATHAGTYFAAPALAELMYGRASRATTDPATVPVAPAR